jgi:DNA recombination protein RmuC
MTSFALIVGLLAGALSAWPAKNTQEVAEIGKQLYDRIAKLAEHWSNVGEKLGNAVEAYNSATSTLESRALVFARKLRDLKAASEDVEIEIVGPTDDMPRALKAPEFVALLKLEEGL